MEIVDLTEDGDDESSEGTPLYEQYEETRQNPPRFSTRPFHENLDPATPRARDADFRPPNNRTRDYPNRHQYQGWEQEVHVEQDRYGKVSDKPRDCRYGTNDYTHHEQRREFVERLPSEQRPQNPDHQPQSMAYDTRYREEHLPEPRENHMDGGQFSHPGTYPHDYPLRAVNLTADFLPRETHRNTQSGNRSVKQWLKTSVPPPPPPSTQYQTNDQQHASQFNFRNLDNPVVVNVPESQESSTVDGHDQLLDNSEGQNSYSTPNTSFAAPPILDQRAHQLKLDLKERFASIRFRNTQSSKIHPQPTQFQAQAFPPLNSQHDFQSARESKVRFREENLDNNSAAKRQRISPPVQAQSFFDIFEPPLGTLRATNFQDSQLEINARPGAAMNTLEMAAHVDRGLRVPPDIPGMTDAELQKVQQEEEERTATRLAHERELLLEKDEDLQRARQEERQALLRIELDEAKTARIEEHRKRMAIMKEKQRAIDEKAAQHKAEEDKRKASDAAKERLAKKEQEAAIREEVLQRSIQARKESELLKAKRAAAIAAIREECKAPPATQKPGDASLTNTPKPSLHGVLPTQKSTDDGSMGKPRTTPKTASDRRREMEEAKAKAEAREPLGLRQVDLENLVKKEKAAKQAEAQRQKKEKRKQKDEAKKFKELRREERRREKVCPLPLK